MSIIVQKFGGTSLGSVECIQRAAARIAREVERGNRPVVVVSAMGHSTDRLVTMAKEISENPSPREMDMLLSTGEQVAMALLAMALQRIGIGAVSMTGWQAGIVTEKTHTEANILNIEAERILARIEVGKVVIVAGFQGVTIDGEITTIGRGGSDTTAVALAAALKADRCDIYTDVNGVFTADPRYVPDACQLSSISYAEMLALAASGAAVLHPRAVQYAQIHRVPLFVKSSFSEAEGTRVETNSSTVSPSTLCGVAYVNNLASWSIKADCSPDTATALANVLLDAHISHVDFTVQQQGEVVFSVAEHDVARVQVVLNEHADRLRLTRVVCETGLVKVSLVGAGIDTQPQLIDYVCHSLNEAEITANRTVTSEMSVSCYVSQDALVQALRTLHSAFDFDPTHKLEPVP